MAPNLKRKRGKEVTFLEKKRQVVPDALPLLSEAIGDDGMDVEVEGDQSGIEDENEEEGEWAGISGGQPDAVQTANDLEDVSRSGTKPKKPPTGEALRAMKDATDLYRSNSFKFKIDALLPTVRPKPSRKPPLDRVLLTLHTFLTSLPSVAPQHPLTAARSLLKKGVAVPYALPLPTEDTNWKVAFEKPSDVMLAGSWANEVSVRPKDRGWVGVDLGVEMPESLFQEKDYLNGRFFHKRAFYLATIAAAVASHKSGLNLNVYYESVSDDPRLTTLILRPRNDDSADDFTKLGAHIRIIPTLPSACPISLSRLSPAHANIRVTSISSNDPDSDAQIHTPTPLYNTAILRSLTLKPHLLATHALKQSTPAFSDALTLLRVWANQRGYGEGKRMCVRGFDGKGPWWSAVLGFLINGEEPSALRFEKGTKRKPLGKGLSSYQLFKAALDFLAKHDFENKPVYLKTADGHRYRPEEYDEHHGPVFVDASSMVNLLAGVPLSSLDMLRYDARKTLEMLENSPVSKDPFTEVFLKEQRDLPTRFDTLLRVDLFSAKTLNPSVGATLDYGSSWNALLSSLASLLRHGLGNRTKAISILHPTSIARPTTQAHPSNPTVIYIGLIHDPEHAFRLVDHGPAADDPDQSVADRFRNFWGEKAELRRFKDGRIVESLVWDVKTSDERAHIPAMVARHILERHFGIGDSATQTWQNSFDDVLKLPESVATTYQSLSVPTGFKGALSAFENFVKTFKALDDELPLSLLNISPVSEYLRYTSVFSPIPHPPSASSLPDPMQYFPPMEIILEFEKSGRWPDDLRAIQKIKLAFFEHIARALMSSMKGLKATVVVADRPGIPDIQDQARLEIVTSQGWAFSARIWHDREATLLDRIINDKPTSLRISSQSPEDGKAKERQDALLARELYTRRFIQAPRHHRAIASLCHRFSAYAGTVRLVKRWLASHWLLHGHISEEVVEIICSSLFVGKTSSDDRVGVPGSKERGFSAVIAFLKDWKWEDGLFVPLYEADESDTSLEKPKVTPTSTSKGVWTVATEMDKDGHAWTSSGPDIVSAHRVRALAKATWHCLQGQEDGDLNVKALFVHPTNDYDLVIQLEPTILPRYFQNVNADSAVWSRKGKYANLAMQDAEVDRPLRPGFDPACLLFEDLQRTYADTLKLFHDPLGGDRYGAVWDPSLKKSRPFRVLGGFSCIPTPQEKEKKDKTLVVLNQGSILSEIERLGSGLIKGITIHT